VVVVLATGIAAGEWLRRPSVVSATIAGGATLVVLWSLRPFRPYRRAGLAVALAALALAIGISEWQIRAIERQWPEQRKLRIDAAYRRLGSDLHAAFHRAERLAAGAATLAGADRDRAFAALERMVPGRGPEMSVVVLDPRGQPWAWAGRHRLAPRAEGDSVDARVTGY
jgi:hypothetical protein